jgi:hypothetical protein
MGDEVVGGDDDEVFALEDFTGDGFVNGGDFGQDGCPVGVFVGPRELNVTLMFPLCKHASVSFFHTSLCRFADKGNENRVKYKEKSLFFISKKKDLFLFVIC